MRLSTFCPAKVNIYLAVVGKRADGYHDLLSLVVPLDFGDDLSAEHSPTGEDELECTDASLPVDASNLVLKAAAAYRRRVRLAPPLAFHLDKRIPHGAGLGGGSSDAGGALRLLNQAARDLLSHNELLAIAAEVGSDVPLFLHEGPVVIRGRGERVEPLPAAAAARLKGLPITLVKPHFGIDTRWAYGALAALGAYASATDAEAALAGWIASCESAADASPMPPLFNSFHPPTFQKFTCYPALDSLLREHALPPLHLSGSGSACFCIADAERGARVAQLAEESLGIGCFTLQTLAR